MSRRLPMLAATLLAVFWLSLALGDVAVPAPAIWGALVAADGTPETARVIIGDLRLPRALTGALVGASLGVAGTICQAIMRNPLADPGIVGINAGAALAATLVIVELGTLPESLLPWFAFAGALIMASLIFGLSWRDGTTSLRIILVGIGLSAFAGAGASFISTFGEIAKVQRAMVWLAGSLQDSRWSKLPYLLTWAGPPAVLVWLAARELDLVAIGDDMARGRGQSVNGLRAAMILAAAMICGAAVAAAGLIAFVGLAAPHIARALVGPRHVVLLPAAALVGAILVLASDLIARGAMPPLQFPVGVVTALLGTPFFGVLLWRRRDA